MPLTLLEGPAGSGKTHFCLEALRQAQREGRHGSTLLLVPAQNAYSLRAALHATAAGEPDPPVILGQPVLTFDSRSASSSFAGWVLRDRAKLWEQRLSETEQLILVRRFLRARPAGPLESSSRTLGFHQELLRLFREWKEALLAPEELEAAFPAGEPGAARQRELCDLYRLYRDELIRLERHDSEDLQWTALEELRRDVPRVRETRFLVDGFSHFTQWQLSALEILAKDAESLTITFPYEEGRRWPTLGVRAPAKRPGPLDAAAARRRDFAEAGGSAPPENRGAAPTGTGAVFRHSEADRRVRRSAENRSRGSAPGARVDRARNPAHGPRRALPAG
jgi:ATP-dependent helicase/nuclease subunit B